MAKEEPRLTGNDTCGRCGCAYTSLTEFAGVALDSTMCVPCNRAAMLEDGRMVPEYAFRHVQVDLHGRVYLRDEDRVLLERLEAKLDRLLKEVCDG